MIHVMNATPKMHGGIHVSTPAPEPNKASPTAEIANAGSRSQQHPMWTVRITSAARTEKKRMSGNIRLSSMFVWVLIWGWSIVGLDGVGVAYTARLAK